MKHCHNPECRAENPVTAKFCRKCGMAIGIASPNMNNGNFTLKTFSNISFLPVSVVKIRFVSRFMLFLLIASLASCFAIQGGLMEEILGGLYFSYNIGELDKLFCALAGLLFIFVLKGLGRKLKFNVNADYIENQFVAESIVRIARKSRLGLFDKKKNKVLLPSRYSGIEQFDKHHLLVVKDGKKGLYSITYRRVIIPAVYDSIDQFANYVTTARVNGNEHHYDVKGNNLR